MIPARGFFSAPPRIAPPHQVCHLPYLPLPVYNRSETHLFPVISCPIHSESPPPALFPATGTTFHKKFPTGIVRHPAPADVMAKR